MDSDVIRRVSEVQKYGGVASLELVEQLCDVRPDGSDNGVKARRMDVIGLPGLGKSSLLRRLFAKFESFCFPVFAIPEAANYAVLKEGHTLETMEAFLTSFYLDAERLAITAARVTPKLVVLREPSEIQNNAFLVMQRALRDDLPAITKLANEYSKQVKSARQIEWPKNLEDALWSQVQGSILATPANSELWEKRFVILTTGQPDGDLGLSLERQCQGDRDPRLATLDYPHLCSYLTAIRGIADDLSRTDAVVLTIHPGKTLDEIELEVATGWADWFQA